MLSASHGSKIDLARLRRRLLSCIKNLTPPAPGCLAVKPGDVQGVLWHRRRTDPSEQPGLRSWASTVTVTIHVSLWAPVDWC